MPRIGNRKRVKKPSGDNATRLGAQGLGAEEMPPSNDPVLEKCTCSSASSSADDGFDALRCLAIMLFLLSALCPWPFSRKIGATQLVFVHAE